MSKCNWCGKEFNKNHNRQMYCSDNCRKYARQEKNRGYFRKYYHKYKDIMTEEKRCGLGSGLLGPHMHKKESDERKAIKTEMERFKIKV